jgi:aminoglycoside 6'-N-acetyltransferase
VTVTLRRARADDADFLVALTRDEEVRPFLGPRTAADRDAVLEEIERSEREPEAHGRFVIEVDGERAGALSFHVTIAHHGIARLGGLAVHPRFRGRRVADEAARLIQRHLLLEAGLHRLELEIYGFNERAQAHAERSGFVREGRKRLAYRKNGEWVDSVLYAIVREDLVDPVPATERRPGA